MKPGKKFVIAASAAMLLLLASCAADRYLISVAPDPVSSEITVDVDQPPEVLADQGQDSQEPSGEAAGGLADVPAGDPAEEVVSQTNPIPFFVPDPDPDDPDPTPVPIPDHETIPIPFMEADNAAPTVSRKVSDPDKFEDGTQYFGRWVVQSRGIDVACYLSISQEVVDTEDAAAFFQFGDQYVIADHSDQDFRNLDSCQPGDLAFLETEDGVAGYICTAIFWGHNTEDSIIDEAGNSIEYDRNTGGITCYTCGDNWQNIHVVLFSPIS